MVKFQLTFAPGTEQKLKDAAIEAAEVYSHYLKDDVTVILSFAASTELPSFVNGAAFNNQIGGFGSDYEITDYEFREALYEDNIAAGDSVSNSAYNSLTHDWQDKIGRYDGLNHGNRYNSRINDRSFNQINSVVLTSANAKALKLQDSQGFIDYSAVDSHIVLNQAFLDTNPSPEAVKSLLLHEIAHGLGFISEADSISEEFGDRILSQTINFQATHQDRLIVNEQRNNFTPLDYFRFVKQTNGTTNNADDIVERSLFPERWLQSSSYFSFDGGKTNHGDLEEGKFTNGSAHRIDELEHSQREYLLSLKAESFQGAHFAKHEETLMSPVHDGHTYGLSEKELNVLNAIGWDVDYNGSSNGSVRQIAWDSDIVVGASSAMNALRFRRYASRTRYYGAENGSMATAFDVDLMVDGMVEDLNDSIARVTSVWIEAEDFASGIDTTPGNQPGAYRDSDVDIKYQVSGNTAVTNIYDGESLTYKPNVVEGKYDLVIRVASGTSEEARSIEVLVGDKTYTSPVFTGTGGWSKYKELTIESVNLSATDDITFKFNNSVSFSFDSFELVYKGEYVTTLGSANIDAVQAEDYLSATGDVLVEDHGSGHNIGWIDPEESWSYRVNAPAGGEYDLALRVASADWDAKSLNIVVNQQTYSSEVFSHTGGWHEYQNIIVPSIALNSGRNDVKIVAKAGSFNFDSFQFVTLNSQKKNIGQRFNIGGSDYTDENGSLWQGFNLNTGGNYSLSGDVNSLDDAIALTQSGAVGNSLNFNYSLPKGKYAVTLGLPEVVIGKEGERVFDVEIENKSYIDDLYLQAPPDFESVYSPTYVVDVADGELNIELTSKVNRAALSFIEIVPTDAPLFLSSPAFTAPSTYFYIEAEDYVDFRDKFSGNYFGQYRTDDVDIETNPHGGYNVGEIYDGEYLAYDFNLATPGEYEVILKVASGSDTAKAVDITINGQTYTSQAFNHTGGWHDYREISLSGFNLAAGIQRLEFNARGSGGFNLDAIEIQPVASNNIRLEAEDYVGYRDLTIGNSFGNYRDDHVDIIENGSGYAVTDTKWGEFLQYDFNLATSGLYDITLNVASGSDSKGVGSFTIDGKTYTTSLFGSTGSWKNYQDIVVHRVPIEAGMNSLQLDFTGKSFNLDYINIEPSTAKITPLDSYRLEAESLSRDTYRIENLASASGGKAVSLDGGRGNEWGHLYYTVPKTGTYNLDVAVYDESDGHGFVELFVNDINIQSIRLHDSLGSRDPNRQTKIEKRIARHIDLKAGDRLEFIGIEEYREPARIDYIDFERIDLNVDSLPSSLPNNGQTIRLEAESDYRWKNDTYRLQNLRIASGEKVLSLVGGDIDEVGIVSFDFIGESGHYNLNLGVYDENDGVARYAVLVNDEWIGADAYMGSNFGSSNATLKTAVEQKMLSNYYLEQGDVVQIRAFENLEDSARLDYIEFEPTKTQTIRIEAETNYISKSNTYWSQSVKNNVASRGYALTLNKNGTNETGWANYRFTGDSGYYNLDLGTFDENDGNASFKVSVNGQQIGGSVWTDQNYSSSNPSWKTTVEHRMFSNYYLKTGDIVQIQGKEDRGDSARIDYLDFTTVDSLAPKAPVRIEAEDYLLYHDLTSGNSANGDYRPGDDVDIQRGATGHNITRVRETEWLSYDVANINGTRDVLLRVANASHNNFKNIELEVDGKTYLSPKLGNTNGWDKYTDLIVNDVDFSGKGDLTVKFRSPSIDFDYIEIF